MLEGGFECNARVVGQDGSEGMPLLPLYNSTPFEIDKRSVDMKSNLAEAERLSTKDLSSCWSRIRRPLRAFPVVIFLFIFFIILAPVVLVGAIVMAFRKQPALREPSCINPEKGLPFIPIFIGIADDLKKDAGLQTTVTMPVLNENQFHEFHILGKAAGTISIQEATLSTSDIIYSIKFNTGEQDLLKKVLFYNPPFDSGEIMAKKSSFVVVASRDDSGDRRLEAPLSYEIVITIPPHLQRLHVTAHSASRVKYLPKTNHKKSLPGIRVSIDKYDVQTTKSSDVLEAPQTPFRLSVDSSWFANEMLLVKRSQLFFSQASLPVQYQWGVISVSAYSQKPSPSDASKGGSIPLSSGDSDKPPETTVFTVQGTAQGLITIKNIERKVTRTVRWDEVVEICTEDEHAYDANHWEPYNTKKARWHRLKSLFDK